MRALGRIVNFSPSDLMVVRATSAPRPGTMLTDRRSKPVGKVVRVTGPVSSPYVLIRPDRSVRGGLTRLLGKEVYISREKTGRGRDDRKSAGGRGRKMSRVRK